MIIFYDKKTGQIKGTIIGRIHTDQEKNMSIPDTDGKLVVEWFKNELEESKPNHSQSDLFEQFEKDSLLVYNYIIKKELLYLKEK